MELRRNWVAKCASHYIVIRGGGGGGRAKRFVNPRR